MTQPNGAATASYLGGRVEDVVTRSANIDRASVRSVEADQASLARAAVRRLNASQASVDHSAVAFARFEQGTVSQSNAGVIVGRSIACDQVRAGILVAPVVRGEVHTWLDMRSAVAIGVGVVLGRVLLAGGRALVRRVAP